MRRSSVAGPGGANSTFLYSLRTCASNTLMPMDYVCIQLQEVSDQLQPLMTSTGDMLHTSFDGTSTIIALYRGTERLWHINGSCASAFFPLVQCNRGANVLRSVWLQRAVSGRMGTPLDPVLEVDATRLFVISAPHNASAGAPVSVAALSMTTGAILWMSSGIPVAEGAMINMRLIRGTLWVASVSSSGSPSGFTTVLVGISPADGRTLVVHSGFDLPGVASFAWKASLHSTDLMVGWQNCAGAAGASICACNVSSMLSSPPSLLWNFFSATALLFVDGLEEAAVFALRYAGSLPAGYLLLSARSGIELWSWSFPPFANRFPQRDASLDGPVFAFVAETQTLWMAYGDSASGSVAGEIVITTYFLSTRSPPLLLGRLSLATDISSSLRLTLVLDTRSGSQCGYLMSRTTNQIPGKLSIYAISTVCGDADGRSLSLAGTMMSSGARYIIPGPLPLQLTLGVAADIAPLRAYDTAVWASPLVLSASASATPSPTRSHHCRPDLLSEFDHCRCRHDGADVSDPTGSSHCSLDSGAVYEAGCPPPRPHPSCHPDIDSPRNGNGESSNVTADGIGAAREPTPADALVPTAVACGLFAALAAATVAYIFRRRLLRTKRLHLVSKRFAPNRSVAGCEGTAAVENSNNRGSRVQLASTGPA